MKSKLLFLALAVLTVISCTKSKLEPDLTSQQKIEKILLEMKALGDSKGKVIVFNLKDLEKENYSKYFEIKPYTEKIYAFNHPDSEPNTDNYTVTCTWSDGSQTTTECGADARCAGAATWDCLDNGGCATVCNARISYKPTKLL